jgi:hypothetical protein
MEWLSAYLCYVSVNFSPFFWFRLLRRQRHGGLEMDIMLPTFLLLQRC